MTMIHRIALLSIILTCVDSRRLAEASSSDDDEERQYVEEESRELAVDEWYVDWDREQCVQNCGQNNIDRLSCGGRKSNLPSSEVYTTPQACCYEMLSYISLEECIKTCPYAYDPEISYDELDVVLIENTNEVYQCKPWPENLYCNQFPPKYKVVAPGDKVIHKPNLGWMKLGTCNENGLNESGADYQLDMMRDSRTYNDEQNMMTAAMSPAMRNQRKRQKYERKKAKKQRQKAMRQQFSFTNTMPKVTQGYILTTTDDAHIYKAQQDRNGNDSALNIYNSRSASAYDIDLEALIKFDVSSVTPNNMKEAIFQIVPLVHCKEELNIEIMAGNQDWYEEEVTWRTAPKRIGPSNIQPNIPEYDVLHKNVWFNIDVTNAIQWGIREQRQRYITFKVTVVGYAGTKSDPTSSSCVLASKEYMDGKYAPSLEIRTDGRSGGSGGGGGSSVSGGIYSESQYDDSSPSNQEDYHTSLHGKESINDGRIPKHPDYEIPEWEPITREGTQHLWYADYSLGSEGGECVRNCKRTSDPNCGGGVAVKDWWLDLYTSPETCCKEKLWWMSMRECIPGLYE